MGEQIVRVLVCGAQARKKRMTLPISPAGGGRIDTPFADRIAAPDLARGFMLLGIAIANVSVFLWGRPVFAAVPHLLEGSVLDRGLTAVVMLTIDQRLYPMFAFLFGYGIVQFARSRTAAGVPESVARRMLLRRHLWLIVFGAGHALLLFAGDILGAYGLTGLILCAIFWGSSDRAIRITVWVLVSLGTLGAVLLAAAGLLLQAFAPSETWVFDAEETAPFGFMSGEPNYWIAALMRLGIWVINTPATIVGLLVPAAVLLGILAARQRWLESSTSSVRLASVAVWGITVGVVGAVPMTLIYLGFLPALENVATALVGFTQVSGLFGGIGYAALFGLVSARARPQTRGEVAVAALGRRSLTFYLWQSVVFGLLLTAWGLGWGSTISAAAAYGLAAVVWASSVMMAVWFERAGRRGPAEQLLRRLTYGRDPEREAAETNAMRQ